MSASPSQRIFFSSLDISTQQALTAGSERLIYQHPADPHLLIKVIDWQEFDRRRNAHPIKQWYRRFRRSPYRDYLSELTEYISSQAPGAAAHDTPLARLVGVVQTTAGLGLLTEKITAADGGLAPTLLDIVRSQGLSPALRADLDMFFHRLADSHIVVNDLGASNIVVGRNANGFAGLWLVDGFGSKQAIPVFALNKHWNRQRIMRKYGEMMVKLEHIDRERGPAVSPFKKTVPGNA